MRIQNKPECTIQNQQKKYCPRINKAQSSFLGKAVTIKTEPLTDEFVLSLLKKELGKDMPDKEANNWIIKIKQICKKNNINIKNLPINEDYKGSLSEQENSNLFTEVFYSVFSDSNIGKIELKAK
ncbi:MAG: hypothetical protein WCF95_02675 [bacterium]